MGMNAPGNCDSHCRLESSQRVSIAVGTSSQEANSVDSSASAPPASASGVTTMLTSGIE